VALKHADRPLQTFKPDVDRFKRLHHSGIEKSTKQILPASCNGAVAGTVSIKM
jgi:hypothetical protein